MAVDASKLRGEVTTDSESEHKDVEGLLRKFLQSLKAESIKSDSTTKIETVVSRE